MLRIVKSGTSMCGLTNKETDGVFVEFDDGSFKGFLGWRSLKQLIQLKNSMVESKSQKPMGKATEGQ